MLALRSFIAYFLLICFVRVMVPDTWLLALHAHEHTVHEATRKRAPVVSAQHQHCSVDQFYNVPFQLSATSVVFANGIAHAPRWMMPRQSVWRQALAATCHLRGPPAAWQA
ncbi:hypothetical protein H8B15_09420 [Hymenobacter sp. BT507]|uniref:Secreted protein n=1 Tax=Hymenobacter citatus TaxID=2763506 RepID=A0ABR7MKL8_9BACT|nr:hypothetical protein [Hymenobacter citatus]MBC6611142.1 hypothetical protein [Hymenobacter citatus]